MERKLFPQEVTGNVPLITITGSNQILIEQHKGLVTYQPDRTVFHTASGTLTICGKELRFIRYRADEALMGGIIEEVLLIPKDGGTVS